MLLAVLIMLLAVHVPLLFKTPIVTDNFTIDSPYWMDGPCIYGRHTIAPYTNKTWWGTYGGTNRAWGVYLHKKWPFVTTEWEKETVDSNGAWHVAQ